MIAALGFCGAVIVGFAYWNYQLSGKNDELLEQNRRLTLEVERLEKRNEQLIDNVAKQASQLRDYEDLQEYNNGLRDSVDLLNKNLAAQIDYNKTLEAKVPKHDSQGRFKKK